MALTNTIGALLQPWVQNQDDDKTPVTVQWLQTITGAKTTQGVIKIIGSATASDEFHLVSANITVTAPTATSYIDLRLGTNVIATFPTETADVTSNHTFFAGDVGVMGGTTTTNTVECVVSTATLTANILITGYITG